MGLWFFVALLLVITPGCTVDGAPDIYPLHIEYRAIDNVCYDDLTVYNSSEEAFEAALAFLERINLGRECNNFDDGWAAPGSKKYYNIYINSDGSWSDY